MEHIRCFLSPTPGHCCSHHCDWFHPAVWSLQEIHINQGEYGNFIPPRSCRLTDSKLEQKARSIGKKLQAQCNSARHCTFGESSPVNYEHLVTNKVTVWRPFHYRRWALVFFPEMVFNSFSSIRRENSAPETGQYKESRGHLRQGKLNQTDKGRPENLVPNFPLCSFKVHTLKSGL